MDLLLASAPRSGSTLLANLLTIPSESVVLHEPCLHHGSVFWLAHEQMRGLGFNGSFDHLRDTRAWLETHDRWGVKENHADRIEANLKMFNPTSLVLLVRDIRHAGRSMYERSMMLNGKGGLRTRQQWTVEAANKICELYSTRNDAVLVQYERLVSDPAYRDELGRKLGWPLEGDPTRALDIKRKNRGYEARRHNWTVGDQSIEMRNREISGPGAIYGDETADLCREYQETFGYAELVAT